MLYFKRAQRILNSIKKHHKLNTIVYTTLSKFCILIPYFSYRNMTELGEIRRIENDIFEIKKNRTDKKGKFNFYNPTTCNFFLNI